MQFCGVKSSVWISVSRERCKGHHSKKHISREIHSFKFPTTFKVCSLAPLLRWQGEHDLHHQVYRVLHHTATQCIDKLQHNALTTATQFQCVWCSMLQLVGLTRPTELPIWKDATAIYCSVRCSECCSVLLQCVAVHDYMSSILCVFQSVVGLLHCVAVYKYF